MSTRTERFVFENRPIGDWLLQLVSEDVAKRKQATTVMTNEFYMPMGFFPQAGVGVEEFLAEFSAAVRSAVNSPSFPAREFVWKLLTLKLALSESWSAKSAEDRARDRAKEQADLEKLGDNPDAAARKRYVWRAMIQLHRDCKRIQEEEPHEALTTSIALNRVIESLDVELLTAADILREMLSGKKMAYLAINAISRMGGRGLEFYDDLLEEMKRDELNYAPAEALGSILKAVPEKIPDIVRLACESSGNIQIGAFSALAACGKAVTDALPEAEGRLREILLANPEQSVWYGVVAALGKCGRKTETVDCLLERLGSEDSGKSGAIIYALGNMGIEPARVVPRLTEMLDTFEEFDPDESYHGEHERVAQALRGFGPAAASAVPALIRHIWMEPDDYWTEAKVLAKRANPDEEVIKLLGELGAQAKEALPVLIGVREEMNRRAVEAGGSPDEDAYWNVAIKRIEAGPKG